MKISNISLLSCLLMTSLLSTPVSAQTEANIERLVKKNAIEVCECSKKLDYIDSFADFEMKFEQCLQTSANDSALQQDEDTFIQYGNLMYENQMQSCNAFATKIDYVLQRQDPKLSDSIYNHQDQYKEIAKSIVGQYSTSSDPEQSLAEGTTIALLNDQRYVLIALGITSTGDWRIVKGKYLHLIPRRTEYPFYVFGRDNAELTDKTKIRFEFESGGSHENTLVHYGRTSQDVPTLTFVSSINNYYPYVIEGIDIPKSISLAYSSDINNYGDEAIDIYTFDNNEEHNDLYVLELNQLASAKTIRTVIGNNELRFVTKALKKRPLPQASSEDAKYYAEVSETKPFTKTLYYNLGGRSFYSGSIDQDNYTFDDDLKAYVANIKCHEDCPATDDYDNTDIFYEYKLLEDVTKQSSKFKIANTFAVARD